MKTTPHDRKVTKCAYNWVTNAQLLEDVSEEVSIVIQFDDERTLGGGRFIQSTKKNHLNTYKLELPKNLKVHPIYHVSMLKLVF
jgi:hypothetical protein